VCGVFENGVFEEVYTIFSARITWRATMIRKQT